jgi:hypothetical protein
MCGCPLYGASAINNSLESDSTTNVMKKRIQSEIDQRRLRAGRACLGELVGKRRRNRIGTSKRDNVSSWLKLPITKVTAIVSPSGAAEPEHDAANNAGLGERQHDFPNHFPSRRA